MPSKADSRTLSDDFLRGLVTGSYRSVSPENQKAMAEEILRLRAVLEELRETVRTDGVGYCGTFARYVLESHGLLGESAGLLRSSAGTGKE